MGIKTDQRSVKHNYLWVAKKSGGNAEDLSLTKTKVLDVSILQRGQLCEFNNLIYLLEKLFIWDFLASPTNIKNSQGVISLKTGAF